MFLSDIDVSDFDTVFIDRDGVINRLRPNDYVKTWEEFEFIDGVFEAFALWNKTLKHIIIITNQRGVGKGLMTEKTLREIHRNMVNEIEKHGGRIDKIYCCIAVNNDDPDRKPNIGMFIHARKDFPDIDSNKALMIGDSDSDIEFAKNAGIKGVKL
ncbi:MAG: HAD-IIIA family hydrolase [Tannerellaceae bacterium]|jgi:histidinol-phosphate phosphatase family protein|nr:HAD-IIIA family hydrolase [Tannerellaceae bacterium]